MIVFGDVMSCRNNSALLDVIATNFNTSALQFITQSWTANAVSSDERMLGNRRQIDANVSGCVCIARFLGIQNTHRHTEQFLFLCIFSSSAETLSCISTFCNKYII